MFATYFSPAELTQVRSVFDDPAFIYELKHVMVSARSRTSKAAPASLSPTAATVLRKKSAQWLWRLVRACDP